MNFPVSFQKSWHGKRFNSYNRVLKDIFGARVYRIGLRMDFTCPNRDGKVAVAGCIYCNNASHTPEDYRPRAGVTEQLIQGAAALNKRHRADRYIGFPCESRDDMLETTDLLNGRGTDGVKLHNLHIIKNTVLEKYYHTGGFALLSRQEYASLVADFLERLNPEMIGHRLTGETYPAITVAPDWSVDKIGVHNAIFKEFEQRDTWQGRLYRVDDKGERSGAAISDCLQGAV